jgi:hypothetical protein
MSVQARLRRDLFEEYISGEKQKYIMNISRMSVGRQHGENQLLSCRTDLNLRHAQDNYIKT